MSGVLGALVLGLTSALSLSIAAPPVKPFPFADLSLGMPVTKLISSHGSPTVVTTDVGQVWTWESNGTKVRVTTDDDGVVHMMDLLPAQKEGFTFMVPGAAPLPLHFGALTVASADERLIPPEFRGTALFPDNGAKAEFRAYKVTPSADIVLLFDDPAKLLTEVFYGDRLFLARGGLLPAGSQGVLPHFTAPALVHVGSTDYPPTKKEGDVFVRISVNKDGSVREATVFVSSGDGDLDRAAVVAAQHATYLPAKIDDVPVSAVAFYREEYRLVSVPPH
ncbi:MAG: hypothetical protein NVSMB31_10640 [Vulcanimicrobiaceae bacterium]